LTAVTRHPLDLQFYVLLMSMTLQLLVLRSIYILKATLLESNVVA